jgi:hypothetical protein
MTILTMATADPQMIATIGTLKTMMIDSVPASVKTLAQV